MTSSAGAAPPFSSAGYSGGISPSPSGGGSPLAGGDLSRAPASGDYSPAAARQSSWNAAAPCAAHPVTPTAAATAVPFGAASGSPAPPPPPPSASPAHPSAAAPAFGGGGAAAAPAVPAWTPEKFHVVHKVFGASNVSKMLQDIPVAQREDAVASLEYEAQARLRDPVYGCVGVICLLQKWAPPPSPLFVFRDPGTSRFLPSLLIPIVSPLAPLPHCVKQKEMVALQEQLKDIEASSLSSSPNATHSSTISGDGAMYGIESSAAAVPSVGAAREEGGEC
ncbi:unnamed protein product [Closterium sp. Naga37s-1]|nr:unnamed protein product [Closterium sp. Naga37s-1]